MNVLQRQMFKVGGPSNSFKNPIGFAEARDIILQERERRGLRNFGGLHPDIVRQATLLQQGVNLERIFTPGGLDTDENLMSPMNIEQGPEEVSVVTGAAPSEQIGVRDPNIKTYTPSLDPISQIRYYVQQGYNAVDIKEMVPSVDFATIEKIVREEGGILNPALRGPESFEQAPDVLRESIPETIVGGQEDIARRKIPVDPIQAELESIAAAPSSPEMDFGGPSKPLPVDLVNVDPSLEPNQYRASDGRVFTIDPERFAEILASENIFELQALIQNPEVEYGTNLENVIRDTVGRRAAAFSSVSPSTFRFGEALPDYLNIQTGLRDVAGVGIDALLEAIEGTYNVGRRALSGFTGERQAETGDVDIFQRERYPMGEDKLIGGFETGILPEESGALRMGIPAETLDQIVARASTSVQEEPIEESIKKLEEQTVATKEPTPVEVEETTPTEEVVETEEETTGLPLEDADQPPTRKGQPPLTGGDKRTDQRVVQSGDIEGAALSVFNNRDFISFLANMSAGLAENPEFLAAGLAKGAALGAKEKEVRDLEEAKNIQELNLELAKSLQSGQMDIKDRKTILDVQTGMSKSVREYNNAVAAEELAQSVIDFANGNQDLATFGSKIGATLGDIQNAIGMKRTTNVDQLSDTKRAQIALDILANRNIKEILGESGRTISNIDRDIANRIIGNLTMKKIQTVAELKTRMEDNIKSIVEKRNEAQRNIRSSVSFLAPYDPTILAEDSELFQIFQRELGVSPITSGQSGGGQEFNIDFRGQFPG
jgi:hypothetical protein